LIAAIVALSIDEGHLLPMKLSQNIALIKKGKKKEEKKKRKMTKKKRKTR